MSLLDHNSSPENSHEDDVDITALCELAIELTHQEDISKKDRQLNLLNYLDVIENAIENIHGSETFRMLITWMLGRIYSVREAWKEPSEVEHGNEELVTTLVRLMEILKYGPNASFTIRSGQIVLSAARLRPDLKKAARKVAIAVWQSITYEDAQGNPIWSNRQKILEALDEIEIMVMMGENTSITSHVLRVRQTLDTARLILDEEGRAYVIGREILDTAIQDLEQAVI